MNFFGGRGHDGKHQRLVLVERLYHVKRPNRDKRLDHVEHPDNDEHLVRMTA